MSRHLYGPEGGKIIILRFEALWALFQPFAVGKAPGSVQTLRTSGACLGLADPVVRMGRQTMDLIDSRIFQ